MKAVNSVFVLAAFLVAGTFQQGGAAQMTAVQSSAKAINYRNLNGYVGIDFRGTVVSPESAGTAEIRNKAGTITIKSRFENLSAPTKFGREYLTYVLWAVAPDGRATNLGELLVKYGRSRLNASVPFQAMSLIVTAEPYFAASQPSSVVVLENAIRKDNTAKIEAVEASYELMPQKQYTLNTDQTGAPNVMDNHTPFAVYQARNAVKIARYAGAETYAPTEFKSAEDLLEKSEAKNSRKQRTMTAREAVQKAEASRLIAVSRQDKESLSDERQLSQDMISGAQQTAAFATKGQAKAEAARSTAETARLKSDSERVKAIDFAQSATSASAVSMEDAKSARAEAMQSKGEAANERANSAKAKVQSESEKAALRAQLMTQFNLILQTRDTARGLVVNMSDVLFKTGSDKLQPQIREKLAKLAGIVLSHPGLKLQMEGHTDNVGGDVYNQNLSEKRAQAAMDYLVSQGVAVKSIVSRGFGKTKPIQSNDSSEGRQMNRRVEMIVTGESIGS